MKLDDLPPQVTNDPNRRHCTLSVNGKEVPVSISPNDRLLDVLRDQLGLTGTKEACGRGECGACTVLLDGRPVVSCLVFAEIVGDMAVSTIEGLAEAQADLRQAFADCGAFQCGFCTPGQIVRGAALLTQEWPQGREAQERFVRHHVSGNLCRCTGYTGIVDALVATHAARAGRSGS